VLNHTLVNMASPALFAPFFSLASSHSFLAELLIPFLFVPAVILSLGLGATVWRSRVRRLGLAVFQHNSAVQMGPFAG
jgi:hypothetical protein